MATLQHLVAVYFFARNLTSIMAGGQVEVEARHFAESLWQLLTFVIIDHT